MSTHPRAGQPARPGDLVNIPQLMAAFYQRVPDAGVPAQRVAFGTSGHRGSALDTSFNQGHIHAICQAVAEYRRQQGLDGPLFLGMDTHALSEAAFGSALEVLVANGVEVRVQQGGGYTPTPVISHAILGHNRAQAGGVADGIVITPSHNPPRDGGIKYNGPDGGPASAEATGWIQQRANELLAGGNAGICRLPFAEAEHKAVPHDYVASYVSELEQVIDLAAIRKAGIRIGVDPLGGSGLAYWPHIAERYDLDITVVNERQDADFGFMTLDHDGKIRMDCSSPYSMQPLLALKDEFDIACGNDPDYDRHGIVDADGLMNPNHYLAVCIHYLFTHRPEWQANLAVGKTLVSSSIIDRVAASLGRPLMEVPVGFKWYVQPLMDGKLAFVGEESAGASFLRRNGDVWTTDKDGFIPSLLAAEILAVTGKTPHQYYAMLTQELGRPHYRRVDASASHDQKRVLAGLNPENVQADTLAGDTIIARLTAAPGNGAAIGGLKVVTEQGWFAARPSGTEQVYKIYAESFRSEAHLDQLIAEARALVDGVFINAGV
ncbi:phosphoglucomutase (alpha-D-glucose-1,6-bisphosphate-dependent) [Oceanimonas sp. CHS3-5]|uniref:phosphoglucomutase (alpha-D-glucose-1,6-bisphosphate-dependent) n=1 Tax=Oceanimonas sp. CHS3-5 TaxID=3068186 RepID=UPI00273DA550|nr:phosphoglucomutase (alpha-D-glucose-1,6-bisphosphate-dependent) [Oceanimonas sp. CHS3-5]MDP5291159.1 phosphoglucomutase (alpha-D-glucose-1,6-bisphosphate-dependent) [Oceanimonas sp. CHS3-5]